MSDDLIWFKLYLEECALDPRRRTIFSIEKCRFWKWHDKTNIGEKRDFGSKIASTKEHKSNSSNILLSYQLQWRCFSRGGMNAGFFLTSYWTVVLQNIFINWQLTGLSLPYRKPLSFGVEIVVIGDESRLLHWSDVYTTSLLVKFLRRIMHCSCAITSI